MTRSTDGAVAAPAPARDELTALLEHASPDAEPRRPVVAPVDEGLPDQLEMSEVRRGLNAIQSKVDGCFAQAARAVR